MNLEKTSSGADYPELVSQPTALALDLDTSDLAGKLVAHYLLDFRERLDLAALDSLPRHVMIAMIIGSCLRREDCKGRQQANRHPCRVQKHRWTTSFRISREHVPPDNSLTPANRSLSAVFSDSAGRRWPNRRPGRKSGETTMRKTIMLGILIAVFGAGALAHARDVTATEPGAAEARQPAVRGQYDGHERHHGYRSHHERHESRHGGREHHDEAHERHHERGEHGRRY
jgi:hypothetical protein